MTDYHEKIDRSQHYKILETAMDGFAMIDSKGNILEVNNVYCKLIGYSEQELLTMKIADIEVVLLPEEISERIKSIIEQGKSRFETKHRRKDGNILDVEVNVQYYTFGGGGFITFIRDITKHKETQRKLYEREILIQNISNNLVNGMIYQITRFKDGTRKFTYLADAVKGLYGITPEEGMENSDLIYKKVHPDDQIRVLQEEELAHQSLSVFKTEARIFGIDGKIRWSCFVSCPRLVSDGVSVWDGIEFDITNLKLAEEALRESEQKYKDLFTGSRDGIVVVDTQGHFLNANAAYCEMVGYSVEELKQLKDFSKITPPKWRLWEDQEILKYRLLNDGYSGIYEKEYIRKDNNIITVEIQAFTVFLPSGVPKYMWGIVRNITERKQAEKDLRQFKAIFDNANFGIAITNLEGMVSYTNTYFAYAHGYDSQELVGKNLRILHSKEQLNNVEKLLNQLVQEGSFNAQEVEHCRKDGSSFTMLMTGMLVKDEYGKPQCFTTTAIDVSEKKLLESQLQQARKMESVGRLAGGVAHDSNNMLGVILGHTELAMEEIDSSDSIYFHLQEIQKAAKHSAELTRQLLTFARKQNITPKVVNLNEVVEGMLKMLARLIGENIHLSWKPGNDIWPIKVDPTQIEQILANVAINARDAIQGIGNLNIKTENVSLSSLYCNSHTDFVPGDYVLLLISDTGIGMDKTTLEHLFEPFFTTKEVGKGTGLGLATIYGIIKQNNGAISVDSEIGHGTTFHIYIPRYLGTTGQFSMNNLVSTITQGNETILLVEDDSAILRMTKNMLQRQGYNVLTAATPKEAICMAREYNKDIRLLITDVVMPEMNGKDLVNYLTSIIPNLKSLFMSGYTSDVIAHNGVVDEDMAFVQKPFSMKELSDKVRKVLDSEKSHN